MIVAEHCSALLRYNRTLVTCSRWHWEITVSTQPSPFPFRKPESAANQFVGAVCRVWGGMGSLALSCHSVSGKGKGFGSDAPCDGSLRITIVCLTLRALFLGRTEGLFINITYK